MDDITAMFYIATFLLRLVLILSLVVLVAFVASLFI